MEGQLRGGLLPERREGRELFIDVGEAARGGRGVGVRRRGGERFGERLLLGLDFTARYLGSVIIFFLQLQEV